MGRRPTIGTAFANWYCYAARPSEKRVPFGIDFKSGRHTDTLRKIFHNLCKILAFEHETVKLTSFNLTFTDFDALFLCFMAFPAHFHAQILLAGHFDCAMKIDVRKSAIW